MTRTWRVGINLLWLVPGNVGGTEEYALRLLRALPNVDGPDPPVPDPPVPGSPVPDPPALTFAIYVTPQVAAAHPWLGEVGRLVTSPDPGESRARRIALETTWLRKRSKDDAFVHHLGGTIPLRNQVPALVTVHDLQPIDRPDTFGDAKRRWLKRRLPSSISESTVVMTPSQWVADRIIAEFGTNPARLSVVPSSHGAGLVDPAPDAIDRLGLTRPYVLYPAITYAHKNHAVLIDAMASVSSDVDLVLTGRSDAAEEQLLRQIEARGLGRRVHRLGRLDPEDFEAVLTAAAALVFPSTYEGFGLPLIEAMAREVPVICADIEVLREVAGASEPEPAARLVAPSDSGAWAATIDQVVTGAPPTVMATTTAGMARAAHFAPEACARRLLDVYRRVLGLT